MLARILKMKGGVVKNIYRLNAASKFKFSTVAGSDRRQSYFHQMGSEPLKFVTVGQLLRQTALKFPDRDAVVSCHENSKITFDETLEKADRLASSLLNLGLAKGDRVAIWSPNFEFWYVSMFAIARAGLVCVAINPAYQLPELDYCLEKVGIKAIIAPEAFRKQKHYEMLTTLMSQRKADNMLQHLIIHTDKKLPGALQYSELLKSPSESDIAEVETLQPHISPDSACNIQFSSGTTGQPKAAVLSHFNMVNNAYDIGVRHEMNKNYRRICINNPFFHVYGIIISILNAMNHGSTLVLPAPHFSPEDALKAIVKEKCDVIYGTPTMLVDLVAKQRQMNVDLPEIAFANSGGAICTPKLVKDVESILKVEKFRSIYGLTETTSAVFQSLPSDENSKVQEFVGRVSDHLEVKIIDKDGNAVPFGQPGELCVRGYNIMLGYWDDEKKTKEVIDADNWLRTADQFVLNENGYGKVVGRLKEMIIRGGENLFPREIEDFLNTHPNILETHVIGIPDFRMGEEIVAFIRLKDSSKLLTRDDIKRFCKDKLSHFKIPRFVIVVEEFPRTVSGKVQKFKFFKTFESELKKVVEPK